MWPRCTPIQQALFRSLGSHVPSSFFRSLVRIPFQFFRVFSCIGSGFFCCFACVLVAVSSTSHPVHRSGVGVVGGRGFSVESLVVREAGARVSTNVIVSDLDFSTLRGSCWLRSVRSCPIGDRAHGFIAVSARMHLEKPVVASSACALTDEFAWWSSLPRLVGVGRGVCSLTNKGQGLCRVSWPGAPLRFSLLDCRSILWGGVSISVIIRLRDW